MYFCAEIYFSLNQISKMKKIITLTFLMLALVTAQGQVKAPAPSPAAKIVQTVGLTEVTIEYSRPSMKDRTIFGGLVPYGEMWRTGANKNTILSFSTDVQIEGNDLAKGSYALFTVPGETSWEVIFYADTENWGTPREWDDAKVAAKFMVDAVKLSFSIESMMFDVGNLTNNSASLSLIWENTFVPLKLTVPTDELVQASIDKTFAGASAGDYYSAARYYREAGKDLDKALMWMNKSLEMGGEKFWIVRQKALIEAGMNDFKAAIASASRSMELAKEAGNTDYVRMNEESIKLWKSMD
jgi:hypothetical protein